MPNLAELILIVIVVAIVLSVHRLGRMGDALGAALARLFGRGPSGDEPRERGPTTSASGSTDDSGQPGV